MILRGGFGMLAQNLPGIRSALGVRSEFARNSLGKLRNGQSTVGGPKWTKMDPLQAKMDQNGPFWSIFRVHA